VYLQIFQVSFYSRQREHALRGRAVHIYDFGMTSACIQSPGIDRDGSTWSQGPRIRCAYTGPLWRTLSQYLSNIYWRNAKHTLDTRLLALGPGRYEGRHVTMFGRARTLRAE